MHTQRRMTLQRELTPSDHDFYIMEIENGFYVDGKHKGSLSRFINHSCDPNCELVVCVTVLRCDTTYGFDVHTDDALISCYVMQ